MEITDFYIYIALRIMDVQSRLTWDPLFFNQLQSDSRDSWWLSRLRPLADGCSIIEEGRQCVMENKHAYSNTQDNIFKHDAATGQTSCRDKKILIRLMAEKVKQSVANHVLPSERRFELNFNVRSLR